MATKKITDLTALSAAPAADDELVIVDTSANETKRVTFTYLNKHPDNVKATFGASDDLQIYHDGSKSLISDQGTGNLKIIADNLIFGNANETFTYAATDGTTGQISLKYGDATKLATTSTGVDVTGTITSDGLGIGVSIPATKLDVEQTFDTVSNILTNGSYSAKFTSSSSGDTGRAQGILLSGASAASRGAALIAEAQSSTNAHHLIFAVSSASSTPSERMRIDSDGNIGLGTTDPQYDLHILDITGNATLALQTIGGTTTNLFFGDGASTAVGQVRYDHSSDFMAFYTTGSEAMRIDSSGHIIVPNGITLGTAAGTYNAANTLDDYESGTFTATVTPSTSGTITLDSAYNTLSYTKVGRQVTVQGQINVSALSSPVGSYVLINLPFTGVSLVQLADRAGGAQGYRVGPATYLTAPSVMLDAASEFRVFLDPSTLTTSSIFYVTFIYQAA